MSHLSAVRTTIATAALLLAPLLAHAAPSSPTAPTRTAPHSAQRCATAKRTYVDPVSGNIRVQTRTVCQAAVGGDR